jgi:hypothetical protein
MDCPGPETHFLPLGARPSGQAGGWVRLDLMVISGRQFVAGHRSYVKLVPQQTTFAPAEDFPPATCRAY